jgi:hypothetical protein
VSRLESSARDYAIAVLSTPGEDADYALQAASTYEPAFDAYTGCQHWKPGDEEPVLVPCARILRARVALYLRLQRRVEAWERDPSGWAAPPIAVCFGPGYAFRDRLERPTMTDGPGPSWWRSIPWRPLWADPSCPAHDPRLTPRMRRGMMAPTVEEM